MESDLLKYVYKVQDFISFSHSVSVSSTEMAGATGGETSDSLKAKLRVGQQFANWEEFDEFRDQLEKVLFYPNR